MSNCGFASSSTSIITRLRGFFFSMMEACMVGAEVCHESGLTGGVPDLLLDIARIQDHSLSLNTTLTLVSTYELKHVFFLFPLMSKTSDQSELRALTIISLSSLNLCLPSPHHIAFVLFYEAQLCKLAVCVFVLSMIYNSESTQTSTDLSNLLCHCRGPAASRWSGHFSLYSFA